MVTSTSVCSGMPAFSWRIWWKLCVVAPLRRFEDDLTISTAAVISTSGCTGIASVSRRTELRFWFVALLFVGLKRTWDAVFPSVVDRPRMLVVMVGMAQKDSYAATHGRALVDWAMACAWSAGSMQFVLWSLRLSAGPLPCLHGRSAFGIMAVME